jgi:two-component system nitrate/nitrite response regulator NarL
MIRVLIIHHNRLFREGLAFVLARQDGISAVASAGRIGEVVGQLEAFGADIYIVDLGARRSEGLEAAREIRCRVADARILMSGLTELEADVLACAEAGAGGCLPEEASLGDLLESIRAITSGEAICSRRVAGLLFSRIAQAAQNREQRRVELPRVTPRERQVIALIHEGLSNKEIAIQLGIELATVKNHVHSILEKLELEGRRELRRYVGEQNIRSAFA